MKFKLTVYPAIEVSSELWTTFKFETAEQMVVAKDTSAVLLLFMQDKAKIMEDYSNMFVMEELIGNEWEEYEEF